MAPSATPGWRPPTDRAPTPSPGRSRSTTPTSASTGTNERHHRGPGRRGLASPHRLRRPADPGRCRPLGRGGSGGPPGAPGRPAAPESGLFECYNALVARWPELLAGAGVRRVAIEATTIPHLTWERLRAGGPGGAPG